jgi:hypothetical protein
MYPACVPKPATWRDRAVRIIFASAACCGYPARNVVSYAVGLVINLQSLVFSEGVGALIDYFNARCVTRMGTIEAI